MVVLLIEPTFEIYDKTENQMENIQKRSCS